MVMGCTTPSAECPFLGHFGQFWGTDWLCRACGGTGGSQAGAGGGHFRESP